MVTMLETKDCFIWDHSFDNNSFIQWNRWRLDEKGKKNWDHMSSQGWILEFQIRGTHLKKLRRVEGGTKIFGVLRVKNHDFTPKNHIFSNFRGGARRVRPPPGSAPENYIFHSTYNGLYSRSKILACRTNSLKNTKIKTLIIVI